MHHHYIVNVVAWTLYPVVQPAQLAAGVFVGDCAYPGHLELLSYGLKNYSFQVSVEMPVFQAEVGDHQETSNDASTLLCAFQAECLGRLL